MERVNRVCDCSQTRLNSTLRLLVGCPSEFGCWASCDLVIRGVVPLRHLMHVLPPPYSIATVVNSLQYRVNSITLCTTLSREIVPK